MDYEQEQVFPDTFQASLRTWAQDANHQMTHEDNCVFLALNLMPKKYRSADKRDGLIVASLARAQAKGVIPAMQPLAVWLEAAGDKPAIEPIPFFHPEKMRSAVQQLIAAEQLIISQVSWPPPAGNPPLIPLHPQTAPHPKTV